MQRLFSTLVSAVQVMRYAGAPFIDDDAYVVVLYGDALLVNARVIEWKYLNLLCRKKDAGAFNVLENPYGYGRIIRDENGKIKNR